MTCPTHQGRSRGRSASRNDLATVSATALAVHRLSDIDAILRTALSKLAELTDASTAVACVIDDEGLLKPVAWHNSPQKGRAETSLRATYELSRRLAKQRAFPIADASTTEAIRSLVDGNGLEALMCVPLVGVQGSVGVVFLGFQHIPELHGEDLDLLTAIGIQTGIAIDRTRQARTDRAARATMERLHRLLDSSLDLILTLDSQGRVTYANARLEEMTGYQIDQVLGRAAIRFVPPNLRRTLWHRWHSVRAGQRQIFDTEFRRADGTCRACQVLISPIEQTDAYLVVMRDLTDERALRSQLIQAEKSAALGRLAAGAAHELNNPLTAVLGFAQILWDEIQDEAIRQDLDRIIRGALRARRIVQDLLAFARQQSPVRSETDVNETLRESLEGLSGRITQARVELVTEFGENLPHLWADGRQLKIVWDNLIKNACQAMEPQGSGRLLIRSELIEDVVRVLVSDTGPGIPLAYLGRIFDPFFTTKEVGKGIGLGLSLCKGIIEAHGGQIWAESSEGEGATFVVELPTDNE